MDYKCQFFRINGTLTGIKVEEPMYQSRSNHSNINHARYFNQRRLNIGDLLHRCWKPEC